MKVAVSTSLVVILCAGVAQADPPAQAEAPKADVPMPECPSPAPTGATVMPPPPPTTVIVQPVSYETRRNVLGPEPQPFVADEVVDSYLDLAPRNAFELGFQGGYVQPFGDLVSGTDISDVVDAGGEVALDLGWRINPMAMFGVTGRFHESKVDDQFGETLDIRGGAVGLQGTIHFAPYMAADPYLTLGAGYRTMWLVPENGAEETIYHGVEIARAQFGVDFRVARDMSIGPNAGAALNMFLSEDLPNAVGGSDDLIEDPRPNAFVFAGLAGRFNIGGTRVSEGVYYGRYPSSKEIVAQK
jgi:hypothetical protein